jgi:photosystem II stability/assembly factor-like uncharacterized protein
LTRNEHTEWEYLGLVDSTLVDTTFGPGTNPVVRDVQVLQNGDIMAAITTHPARFPGIFRSTDDGATWQRSDFGVGDTLAVYASNIYSLAANPCDPRHILAGSNGAILRSVDRGNTWRRLFGSTSSGLGVNDIDVHPRECNIVWAGGETSRFAGYAIRSSDAGLTWESVDLGSEVTFDNYFHSVALDPFDTKVVYVSLREGAIKSKDGGDSWVNPAFSWAPNGSLGDTVFDEEIRGHLFIACGDAVYESWDDGETAEILQRPRSSVVWDMEYDSLRKILYVATESGIFRYVIPAT